MRGRAHVEPNEFPTFSAKAGSFERFKIRTRWGVGLLAQLSQLAGVEGQNARVFKGGEQKVFTTKRGWERAARSVRR